MTKIIEFSQMIGKTMIEASGEAFCDTEGNRYTFSHNQACCEFVDIVDIEGEFEDLIGNPILVAEEITDEYFEGSDKGKEIYLVYGDCENMWTFYKFSTIKGTVIVRWFGSSNGYYGEEVDYRVHVKKENDDEF